MDSMFQDRKYQVLIASQLLLTKNIFYFAGISTIPREAQLLVERGRLTMFGLHSTMERSFTQTMSMANCK